MYQSKNVGDRHQSKVLLDRYEEVPQDTAQILFLVNDPGFHDLSNQNSFVPLCYFKPINVKTNGLVDQVAHNY
jgi:hypothetical protein